MLLAEAAGIDLDGRAVTASAPDGERLTLAYDSLIVAAGAGASYFGHDDWEAVAPGLKTLDDARILGAGSSVPSSWRSSPSIPASGGPG